MAIMNNYDKALEQKGGKERCKMKMLNGYRMRLLLIGVMAGMVFGGGTAKADFTFGEPVNLGPTVNSSSGDGPGCFSSDRLEMYIDSERPGGGGSWDIWVTTRETIDDDWGTPVNLGPVVNTEGYEFVAHISHDGLELYFTSNRTGGYGSLDMWVTRGALTFFHMAEYCDTPQSKERRN